MKYNRKSRPLGVWETHPIDIFRRELGLSEVEFSKELGYEGSRIRYRTALGNLYGMGLLPLIEHRWGRKVSDRLTIHIAKKFRELKKITPEEWETLEMEKRNEKEEELERRKELLDSDLFSREFYDPTDDIRELLRQLKEEEESKEQ